MSDVFDIIKQGFTPKQYVVGEWLAKGEMAMIFAGRGVGKTYIALLLAHSIACRNDFLCWPTKGKGVMYFDGEMGKEAISRRLKMMDDSTQTANGLVKDKIFIQSYQDCAMEMMWNLSDPNQQKLYDECIEKSGCDVVIIDNINTCHHLMDNRDNEMSAWIRIQKWAVRQKGLGRCLIFIHHAGKSGMQLGTSQKENIQDYIIELKKSRIVSSKGTNGIEWHVDKSRDVAPDALSDMFLEYHITESDGFYIRHSPLNDAKKREVKRLVTDGFTKPQIAEKLNIPKWLVTEYIKDEDDKIMPDRFYDGDDVNESPF